MSHFSTLLALSSTNAPVILRMSPQSNDSRVLSITYFFHYFYHYAYLPVELKQGALASQSCDHESAPHSKPEC